MPEVHFGFRFSHGNANIAQSFNVTRYSNRQLLDIRAFSNMRTTQRLKICKRNYLQTCKCIYTRITGFSVTDIIHN